MNDKHLAKWDKQYAAIDLGALETYRVFVELHCLDNAVDCPEAEQVAVAISTALYYVDQMQDSLEYFSFYGTDK